MRKAFTLIELIVVVSIVVYLSTIFIFYNAGNRQAIAVSVEKTKIAQLIMRAKSLALASYATPGVACGYGVSFDRAAGTYTLSAYTGPSITDNDCRTPSLTGATVFAIDKVNLKFVNCADAMDEVIFLPPEPTVVLWAGGSTTTVGTVCIQSNNAQNSSTVMVNSAGQVSL